MHQLVMTRICAVCLGVALVACGTPDRQTAAKTAASASVAPMLAPAGIPMALASNYGFMSLQFNLGDVAAYMSNFADSARLTAPDIGVLHGRDSIAFRFAGAGKRFGVKEFNRTSLGFRIEGRDVRDSGSYKLVTEVPLAKGMIGATGRYWTHWRYTDDGRWLIVSDSLAGDKR